MHEYVNENSLQGDFISKILLQKWIVNLIEALDFIHAIGIIHMDVKLANILLNNELTLKLADFDIALDVNLEGNEEKFITNQSISSQIDSSNACAYAPELVNNQIFSFSVDIWAAGIVFFNIVTLTD